MNTELSKPQAEAIGWLARLHGRESREALQAFERWRAMPANAAAFEEAERFWLGFDQVSDHAEVRRLTAQALADLAGRGSREPRSPLKWALAASLAIVTCAAAAFLMAQYHTRTYLTGMGQRSTIQLADGSEVTLNFATELEVKLTGDERRFKLKRGEALFNVADDPHRPFVVAAGDGRVRALGTRFQVRSEHRQVTVTLLDGKVALDRREARQHVQLNPGDQVKFTVAATALSWRTVNPDVVSSWTTGRLKFEVTPLVEVLEEVNRYTDVRITVLDPSLARTPVTGVFTVGDSESVVAGLLAMLPLEIVRQDEREIVLARR